METMVEQTRTRTNFEVDLKTLELLPADEPEALADEFLHSCGSTCFVYTTLFQRAQRPKLSLA